MTRTRIAVLASGGGTNLQAILDHFERLGDRRSGDVIVVASDRPGAGALARARARGIAAEGVGASADVDRVLDAHDIELVVLRSEERRVGKEGRSRWSPYH